MKRSLSALLLLVVPSIIFAASENIAGLWDATIVTGNNAIPFRVGFSGTGSDVKGWFFNGEEKEVSNSGSFENGTVVLNFDSYASVLKASVKDGVLDGQYTQRGSH